MSVGTSTLQRRALGVAFIVLLATGIWFVGAIFSQTFTKFDRVSLRTDSIGLQLPDRADVKYHGVIVGQVLEMSPDDSGATLKLGINPDKIGVIPANATAMILPKTLFGEKYVELDSPANAEGSLKAGDELAQTQLPIELERVLNDLYPLLKTIEPAQLSYTLNAVATALEGRGAELGKTAVTLNDYLKKFNPQMPALMEDLKALSQVSKTYGDATPALARTLRNTIVTGNTFVEKTADITRLLQQVGSFSDTAKGFFDKNGDNLIQLGNVSAPQLALIREYSKEFPCLAAGLAKQVPLENSAFRNKTLHINLTTIPHQPRGYTTADKPVFDAKNSWGCYGMPNRGFNIPDQQSPNWTDGVNDNGTNPLGKRVAPGFAQTYPGGTAPAQATVSALTTPLVGKEVDQGLVTLLFAPMAAGNRVSVQ